MSNQPNLMDYSAICDNCGQRRTVDADGLCHECWQAEIDNSCKDKSYDRQQRRAESGYAQ